MATARKNVRKTSEKATMKATKEETKKKVAGPKRGRIEERVQVPLSGGRFVDIRITIASTPKVGPGPRPNMQETFLIRRIDENQVLTIGAELGRHPTAAIVVGPGRPPGGGN